MGVYGRNAYGDWSYDGSGPSLVSSSPATGATYTGTDVLTYFTITSGAGIDVNLLNVYDGTNAIILGGYFVNGFNGVITVREEDCEVTVSTYPTWSDGSHTINIDVTDLAGTQDDLSYTFNTGAGSAHYDVGVGDTVTVSDAVDTQQTFEVPIPETVTVSDAVGTQQTFEVPTSETVTVSDAVGTQQTFEVPIPETVTVSESLASSKSTSEAIGETVTVSEALLDLQGYGVPIPETVTVSESLALAGTYTQPVNETVTFSESLVSSEGETRAISETVTVSESLAPSKATSEAVGDTVSVSESLNAEQGAIVSAPETVSFSESLVSVAVLSADVGETVVVSDAVGTDQGQGVLIPETVSVSEAVEALQGHKVAHGEAITLNEIVIPSRGGSRGAAETIVVTDSINTITGKGVPLSETVVVSEGLSLEGVYTQGASEAVPIAEFVNAGLPIVSIVEAIPFSESLVTHAVMTTPLDIEIEVFDDLDVQKNDESRIEAIPGSATKQELRVYLDDPLGWSPRGATASFNSLKIISTDGGVPAKILGVTREHDIYQTGNSGYLVYIDENTSNSNIFSFPGEAAALAYDPINKYLEITSGGNEGIYKITGLVSPTGQILLELDRALPLLDPLNGYVQGRLEYVDRVINVSNTVYTFILNDARITETYPLLELLYLEVRGNLHPSSTWALGSTYNTIEITVPNTFPEGAPGPLPWPWNYETDIVFAATRVSPKVDWRVISGVTSLLVETSKLTAEKNYQVSAESLLTSDGRYVDIIGYTILGYDVIQKPRAVWAGIIGEEGVVLVQYDQPMQTDADNLFNPQDYQITGPTSVEILQTSAHDVDKVALYTTGLSNGDYTLTISTSTPKDVAGNPLDPTFNSAIFTSVAPLASRSVFTDRGPIAKPPLTIQSGTGATIETFTEVTLTGASLTSNHVGKYVTLSGGSTNDGTFRVTAVISSTRARLQVSFTLPDATSFAWELFDPQDGILADDPADVTVRVNGVPVIPDAVVGLMGQIVLNSVPAASDDVKIDYSWCCNPTVDFRRLNSKEFRLNAWNRDQGYPRDANQHRYRYNNVLVRPSDYEPLDPRAVLDQPEERELHYRAYERAYTPVLNDPTLLVLNTPIHRIAYPPAQRQLSEQFVAYEGLSLPENLVVDPWTRRGSGTASVASGYLTIEDDTTGPFPTGQPIFWTRNIDVTFPHVFAMSWRFQPTTLTELDGVFSGIAAGYSDDIVAVVVGFLEDGGVKKIGILKRTYGDDPSTLDAWVGGLDATASPTGLPAEFDWGDDLHSYRILRNRDGVIGVFVDGEIDPILQVLPDELPYLEELNAPFDEIQGAFFGSLSRPARSISRWDFVRYLIQPTNPVQTSASSFVSYEANVVPEADTRPWTLVGFHGTATIISTDFLLLDSTSGTNATGVGNIGGSYRGYFRFEPLLSYSSEFVVDAKLQIVTATHGISQGGVMFAVDDSTRLMQVSFLSDLSTPLISYGGLSLPGDFTPYAWSSMGTQTAVMAGRILRVTDASTTDGLVYYYDDTQPVTSDARVVASTIDYILEFRCKVRSYTVDGSGLAGAAAQVFDGIRSVGLLLRETAGTKYATFQSDGVMLSDVAFDWGDGEPHTYRLTKDTAGDLVTLFIDGQFAGSLAYSSFPAPAPSTTGQITFGSATPASMASESVVDWYYCNVWRLRSDRKHYVGIWKGTSTNSFLDYHLPVKEAGRDATVLANALGDGNATFLTANVVTGDYLIVDDGPNAGVYEVASVTSENNLTITTTWPQQPSLVTYRIAKETDWTDQHKYRLARDSQGNVSLLLDAETSPLIQVGYNSIDLPISGVSSIRTVSGNLPCIVFGAFESSNLSQSLWDYVRYGITRSPTELRIVPHHEVINQWNVMHSPERLYTQLPHTLTDFKSSSTGQPPKTDPDFLEDPDLRAFTVLNEGTPIVPLTQSFEVRAPYPTTEFISALNRPEDVLNSDADFTLNDGSVRYKLIVPNDVLYSSLDIIEQTTGEQGLIAPFSDGCGCMPDMKLEYTKEVCLTYDGDVLPENDTSAPTPWYLLSDDPARVSTSVFGSVLTFATDSVGTRTVYRNDTSLPDAPSLRTEAQFRMRVLNDGTLGTDDTQIRAGLSAPGLTVALAFVTTPLAERYVLVIDLNNGTVVGGITFDFLDGNYHTYHIVRDPCAGVVQVSIS